MDRTLDKAAIVREHGKGVDFGKTSEDYARHRPGPPASFYDRLERYLPLRGARTVDVGTGTGVVALELAARRARVTGIDTSEGQLAQARTLAAARGLQIEYRPGPAEDTGLPSGSFDLWIASQSWHWFDPGRAGAEARRLLRPGGLAVCVNFDYLPGRSSLAKATEDLILKYNPAWPMAGGNGVHVRPLDDLPAAGLDLVEQVSWEHMQPFTHEGWRGRMRTCNGVGATLPPDKVEAFDKDLALLLARDHPGGSVEVCHRVWMVVARRAA